MYLYLYFIKIWSKLLKLYFSINSSTIFDKLKKIKYLGRGSSRSIFQHYNNENYCKIRSWILIRVMSLFFKKNWDSLHAMLNSHCKAEHYKKKKHKKIKAYKRCLLIVDLKVVSATFMLVYFLNLNESPCQTRKNAFYFTSKALFILKKIKF